jgi:hypothetical protein
MNVALEEVCLTMWLIQLFLGVNTLMLWRLNIFDLMEFTRGNYPRLVLTGNLH